MAARRGRGSTAVRVIFSQHAEILQYSRKTITGRFYATDRLDVLYRSGARDLEFTGVCIMVFYYTGQIVTFQLRRARPQRPSHPLCLSPLRVLYMRWVGEGMHCQGELVKR